MGWRGLFGVSGTCSAVKKGWGGGTVESDASPLSCRGRMLESQAGWYEPE